MLNNDPRHNNREAQYRGITTIVRWARCLNGDTAQANGGYYNSDVAGLGSKIPDVHDAVQIQTAKTTAIAPIQYHLVTNTQSSIVVYTIYSTFISIRSIIAIMLRSVLLE